MSENCSHDCANCSHECKYEKPHKLSKVKHVIGVMSGKGGVGKSLVTSTLAVLMNRMGFKTAVLDADITGPSAPKQFGIKGQCEGSADGIYPRSSSKGIEVISSNLLLDNETDPILFRGPLIAGMVKQFWTDVIWRDIDVMFIDMPPGTGDVALTVFQSIPVDSIIVVSTPQELVGMIVEKSVKMAEKMNINVLGLVENMSYFECPKCGEKTSIFGDSKVEEIAKQYNIPNVAKMPINKEYANLADRGLIELFDGKSLDELSEKIAKIVEA